MRLIRLLMISACLLLPSPCLAAMEAGEQHGTVGFKIHGPGYTAYGTSVGCVQIVRQMDDSLFNYLNNYLAGYLSASNHLKSRHTMVDPAGYARWIMSYCLENPTDNLVIAAEKLDRQLDQ